MTFALAIDGMHCGACVRRVKTALERLPGVTVTEVVVGSARGEVEGVAVAEVVAAVTRAGYPAREA
jgi:copper chaperone